MWKENDDRILEILNIFSEKDSRFPVICPVCGEKDAHIYIHRHSFESQRGGLWLWCSSCRHSSHSSYRTPLWWKNLNSINTDKLVSLPDYLEANKNAVDKWVNELKNGN